MGQLRYKGKHLATDLPPSDGGKGRRVQKEERKGFWKNYGYLLITAAAVVLLFRVILQLAFVPSGSMESTIPTDSLLISWQLSYLAADPMPQRGDVVTFWSDETGKLLVKRVIGVGGDEITISDGTVYCNGEALEEPYLQAEGITESFASNKYRVPEGCLFFMGDNRGNSFDSRRWSMPYIAAEKVHARVLVCIPLKAVVKIPLKLPNTQQELTLYLPILNQIHGIS